MRGLPVALNLAGARCLVVGAGPVGRRKAATLTAAGADVTVIAPERNRPFRPGDSAGHRLVVAAADDVAVNDAVEADAHRHGAWCNRADRDDGGDLAFGAAHHGDGLTVAVWTDGPDPRRAQAVRDRLAGVLGAAPLPGEGE
jgi:precorrin-2 dehydrogenase/sirohydrochlorin ferrochelatase